MEGADMEQLLVWVKKLAVFMILCSYMEHLLPAQYKRYFHMCTRPYPDSDDHIAAAAGASWQYWE